MKGSIVRAASLTYCLLAVSALASCSSGPTRVTPPDIDPADAAEAAIAQYDKNGDGALSADEIEASALTIEKWDADKNGSISEAEIEQRLTMYVEGGTGMSAMSCYVRHNNRPLADAQVTFKPEEFLGDVIHPAYGTTGRDGTANMSVAEEFRLTTANGQKLESLQLGLYTVEITHPQVTIREVSPSGFELPPKEEFVNPTFVVQ